METCRGNIKGLPAQGMRHAKERLDQPRQGPPKVLLNPALLSLRQTRTAGSKCSSLRIDDVSDVSLPVNR
jgi:hypothetical protein